MEPVPAKAETAPKIPTPETKPTTAAKEKSVGTEVPTATAPEGTPRNALEKIANGTPVAESTAPQKETVQLLERKEVTKLLEESNTLLLELKDMRLLLTAIATQAADTPLGNETRIDALRIVRDITPEGLPEAEATKLKALQETIRGLNLPDANPANSQLIQTISKYNETHKDTAVPQEVIDQIKAGKQDVPSTVAQMMQSNPDLAESVWKDLTGVEGFTGLKPTPENILQLAGIATTPENMAKAAEVFGIIAALPKNKQGIETDKLMSMAMMGGLIVMFFTQLATGEGGGGGH